MPTNIKEHNINSDTVLIPHIIAEDVIRTFLTTDKKYSQETDDRKYALLQALTNALTDKAEKIYQHSEHFRDSINDKKTDCRHVLATFMNHWLQGEIKRILKS